MHNCCFSFALVFQKDGTLCAPKSWNQPLASSAWTPRSLKSYSSHEFKFAFGALCLGSSPSGKLTTLCRLLARMAPGKGTFCLLGWHSPRPWSCHSLLSFNPIRSVAGWNLSSLNFAHGCFLFSFPIARHWNLPAPPSAWTSHPFKSNHTLMMTLSSLGLSYWYPFQSIFPLQPSETDLFRPHPPT